MGAPEDPATAEGHAVPPVSARMAWWQHAEMFYLLHVLGPIRRRRRRPDLPPPLTAEETARRLYALPISYWTYDFEPGVRHLGPMAQDFAAAFGLGNTNRKIHMVDANGVAVVALQVLQRRVRKLEHEVERLRGLLEAHPPAPADVSGSRQTQQPHGHRIEPGAGSGSRAQGEGVVMDEQNVDQQQAEDVEGHRIYAGSDRGIKHDVTPVVSEDEDDDGTGED